MNKKDIIEGCPALMGYECLDFKRRQGIICQNNPFCKIKKILQYSESIKYSVRNVLKKELEEYCDNALINEFETVAKSVEEIQKLLEEKG